jgi:thiol-disulfide isomerase/thioredoxin
MYKLFLAILLMTNIAAGAQTKAYDTSRDAKNGQLVFNGPITFSDLFSEPSFTWLQSGIDEYKPNAEAVAVLQSRLKEYTIVVFIGTWCDDSHYLLPKLTKVLQLAGYPLTGVTMYGTDRDKKTKNGEQAQYGITLVPTIILLKNGKEAGRITESALKSVEEDLAKMVSEK